jgi:lipid-binding SYLF domain-containing protein
MRKMNLVTAAFAATVMCGLAPSSVLAKDEPAKVGTESKIVRNDALKIVDAAKTVKEIAALPKRKIPPVLFNEATAVVIVPKAAKQAFMVSGGTTGGVLLVRSKAGTWSDPVFVTLTGGTLGWQIVGDPMDIILLYRNNRQIDAILKGKITLDTKTAIVPGRLAATMKGASKEELAAEITSYVRGRGVFAEDAVVAGTSMQIDAAANDSYYAKPKVDPGEIISGKVSKPNEHVSTLQKLLTDYAAAK